MKKAPVNSGSSKNQMTLGQFWSSSGSKAPKPERKSPGIIAEEEDDDIELLAAMEQFEQHSASSAATASSSTTVTTKTTTTTTTVSTSKWPISYKAPQDPKQNHQASISAPKNDNEPMQTYPDFDRQSGSLWIYPTNYEKRDYQFKIVSAALFQNTLVVLPTGLGKTFIAAVVMFNFCRWYPTGKIIFTAPTKPLVAQQMEACAKVMGIRRSEMCEMTGGVSPEERRRLWLEKRVFFLTPQTLNNDLVKATCPWSKIRCLIIDEAHRALGQHAYCQVVQEITKNGEQFRILGLSATPGNNVEAVQNVIQNLKISHIEMFTDESPDIKKHSFDKIIDKIVVGPNQLMQDLRRCILIVLKPPVETLAKLGVIYQKSPEYVTCGSIIMTMKRVSKDKPPNLNDKQYQEAKSALFFAISFYHALDELEKHGLQSVYNFFKKKLTEDKKNGLLHATFRNHAELSQLYTELQNLFDLSQVSTQQRRTTSLQVGHPKLAKLRECVVEHFQTFERTKSKANDQTRVIIFSEKRDSVREITELLEQDKPLVKPMSFIGQASSHAAGQGINQKLQKKVVSEFRLGGYNVLVATSIGEEGLDIGSVDLIICFDALKSPIRLVQRMGRTGRARQGRIVLLMTEGKEERTFHEGEAQQKRIFKLIVDGARMLELYRNNLRMVPHDIQPICQEMAVKMTDDVGVLEKETKKRFKNNESEFSSSLNKTKQQESVLKLFRKEKLLNDNEFYHWVRNYQCGEDEDDDDDDNDDGERVLSAKDRVKSMIKTAMTKWSNEQRDIQSPSMHSSRTKTWVDFMQNYTSERVYVDISDHAWSMNETTVKDEAVPMETVIPSRPTMPSPFDRSTLKEQIRTKRACSPVDLTRLPEECDRLLNLPPIIRRQEETEDEEIDCTDLFGSKTEQIRTKRDCSPVDLAKLPKECHRINPPPIIRHQEETEDEEIDCNDLFGSKKEQIRTKRDCSPVDLAKLPGKCDRLANLPPIIRYQEENQDEEIDCGDLFGTGSTFDITYSHPDPAAPTASSPARIEDKADPVGNFDITMDDFFPASQSDQISPTLQLTDVKSQTKSVFADDDDMNDDELLEAFNKHMESSSQQIINPSPVLVLSNRVDRQHQPFVRPADVALPKFDLEFSFADLDDNDHQTNNVLETSLSAATAKSNVTSSSSDHFETPIRPVPSKKRVRRLSTITPDIIEKKRYKSAQELGLPHRHFHRRLASDFLDREAAVDDTPSNPVSSDEEEHDHDEDHDVFIDDRQVLTQLANIDMTSVYLRSLKSPKVNVRPARAAIPMEDIYSQLPNMTMNDDQYDEDDSFVDDTTQLIDDHHGEVDFDELANILGTQSVVHRPTKVTRRGVKFGRTSETTTPQRRPPRRVQIAQSPM